MLVFWWMDSSFAEVRLSHSDVSVLLDGSHVTGVNGQLICTSCKASVYTRCPSTSEGGGGVAATAADVAAWLFDCNPARNKMTATVMQVFRQLPEFRQSRVSNKIFRQFVVKAPSIQLHSEKLMKYLPIDKLDTWKPPSYRILLQFFHIHTCC